MSNNVKKVILSLAVNTAVFVIPQILAAIDQLGLDRVSAIWVGIILKTVQQMIARTTSTGGENPVKK